jgi:hypothetical protein
MIKNWQDDGTGIAQTRVRYNRFDLKQDAGGRRRAFEPACYAYAAGTHRQWRYACRLKGSAAIPLEDRAKQTTREIADVLKKQFQEEGWIE